MSANAILEGHSGGSHGAHPTPAKAPLHEFPVSYFYDEKCHHVGFFFFFWLFWKHSLGFSLSGFLYVSIISRLLGGLVSDRQQRHLVLTVHVLMEEMWPEPMSPHPQKGSDS